MRVDPLAVTKLAEIPFLPISFFRTHRVVSSERIGGAELIFESSGTTGEQTSRHFVLSRDVYEHSLIQGFQQFYGSPGSYALLALLPSYLERPNASLVYMAKTLMGISKGPDNGFYVNEWDKLAEVLLRLEKGGKPALLLGVTFALLDFAEKYPMQLKNTTVMETGGMKGRRKEQTREEVHAFLQQQWGLNTVHSEYGMTELLSQAYSAGKGLFAPTATMRALVRDVNDPLEVCEQGNGVLNIIDLANVYSCSFIATDDLGAVNPDGTFTVTGRLDNTVLRGCSQLAI